MIINAQTRLIAISGICDPDKSTDEKELILSQFNYGQIKINAPLPVAIKPQKATAELIDGVLTVTMPKLSVKSAIRF